MLVPAQSHSLGSPGKWLLLNSSSFFLPGAAVLQGQVSMPPFSSLPYKGTQVPNFFMSASLSWHSQDSHRKPHTPGSRDRDETAP